MGSMTEAAVKGFEKGVRPGAVIGLLGGLYLNGVRTKQENSPEHLAELLRRGVLPSSPQVTAAQGLGEWLGTVIGCVILGVLLLGLAGAVVGFLAGGGKSSNERPKPGG